MAITKRKVWDEDWKTAIAQNKNPIPEGTEVRVVGITQNLYGDFIDVEYNGTRYSVNPRAIKINPEEWESEGLEFNGREASTQKIIMLASKMWRYWN